LIATGKEVVLRRMHDYDTSANRVFIRAVQNARPISDVFYLPLNSRGHVDGFWSLARAGLRSPWFSNSDLELFRFVTTFLDDAFQRSLLPPPLEEDVAFLDFRGRVTDAGARIKEAFDDLFGKGGVSFTKSSHSDLFRVFLQHYDHFLRGPLRVGRDQLSLCTDGRRYSFLFKLINPQGIPLHCPGLPHASVRLLACPSMKQSAETLDLSCAARHYNLTARECEVVRGIYQAQSNKVIALSLGIDESTVKRHTHNIYEKTGLRSRVELVQNLSRSLQNQLKL
jgi:DNA-binding CsgD family transcriptional regulator